VYALCYVLAHGYIFSDETSRLCMTGMGSGTIYLDHNATAPVLPAVSAALAEFALLYGNPSAPYALGQSSRRAVSEARESVASLIGASSADRIVFTSGGTESNNLAIKGALAGFGGSAGGHIVISSVEHPAVLEVAGVLEAQGVALTVVPVRRDGRVRASDVLSAVRPDTWLVSVMHANNETGVLQPVEEIGAGLRGCDTLFHVDGVQAAGRIPVSVESLNCDSYSLSGHKFGALKGVGALYVRNRSSLCWIQQGGHQEWGLRAGTENVPGICAMGLAARIAAEHLVTHDASQAACRAVFDGLAERVPMARLNGSPEHRLPNTSNLCFLYADAMSVCMALSVQGIFVGTGSACASHTKEPSRVLRAMGLSDMAAYCSVRISTGPSTTLEQARYAADQIAQAVERIRLVSAPDSIGECDENCPCFVDAPATASAG
jgi:cysteine desulfurase